MGTNYSHSDLVMEWAKVFHWAEKRHFQLAIHGVAPKRQRRMEIDLRRLSQRKKLRTARYGKKLVYALPRTTRNFDEFEMMSKIQHGLACTEILVKLYLSRTDVEIIPERFFRGCGSVPEFGLRYPEEKILLPEYTSKSNFFFYEMVNGKLNAYISNLARIENKFRAKGIVVFVIDVSRDTVKRYVGSLRRDDGSAGGVPPPLYEGTDSPSPFFFTDYETFLKTTLGKALYEPIYFWVDGHEYPLSKHD